eukprot:5835925-Prymnesium_polylepis.1
MVHQLAALVVHVVLCSDKLRTLLHPSRVVEEHERALAVSERLDHQILVALDHRPLWRDNHAQEAQMARGVVLAGDGGKMADAIDCDLGARVAIVFHDGVDAPRWRHVVRDQLRARVHHKDGERVGELALHKREVDRHRLEQAVRGREHHAQLHLAPPDLLVVKGKLEQFDGVLVRAKLEEKELHVMVGRPHPVLELKPDHTVLRRLHNRTIQLDPLWTVRDDSDDRVHIRRSVLVADVQPRPRSEHVLHRGGVHLIRLLLEREERAIRLRVGTPHELEAEPLGVVSIKHNGRAA